MNKQYVRACQKKKGGVVKKKSQSVTKKSVSFDVV